MANTDSSIDRLPDLIVITGTPQQLARLRSIPGLNVLDHGQKPLDDGRWMVLGNSALADTADVLAQITALGAEAGVPLSMAERRQNMQPPSD